MSFPEGKLPPSIPSQGVSRPGEEGLTSWQVADRTDQTRGLQISKAGNEQILILTQRIELLEARLNQWNRITNILNKLNPNRLHLRVNELFDKKPGTVGGVLTASTCITICVGSYLLDPESTQKANLEVFAFMFVSTAFGAGMFKMIRMGEQSADEERALQKQSSLTEKG